MAKGRTKSDKDKKATGKTKSDKDKKSKWEWRWYGPVRDRSDEMKALRKMVKLYGKPLTEDQRAKILEKQDINVRGYFHGGKVKGYGGGGKVKKK